MEVGKRLCLEKEDRISELPGNVMDSIFEKMPNSDAARTSILSRKWRYTRASCPKLVFDMDFFKEINVKYRSSVRFEFSKVVNKTLFGHCGSVLHFLLYIPNIPNDLSLEIDQWMLFLSRNGIKKLELQNMHPIPYVVPSYMFLCHSLIDLRLRFCILKPSSADVCFRHIVTLKLVNVSFSSDKYGMLLIDAPVLKNLTFLNCTGIENRIINAPVLAYFCWVKSGRVDWQKFRSFTELLILHVELGMEYTNSQQSTNLIKFLLDVPKVRTLWLDGFSLQYLAAGNPPQSLTPTRAPLLTCVRLRDFRVDDLVQISSAFFLLKSCLKSRTLELDLATSIDNVTEPVKGYLSCMSLTLGTLQTVKIRCVKGHEAELFFIKFLLLRCICLKRMFIEQSTTVSASDGFKISREILRFCRASTIAEIIY